MKFNALILAGQRRSGDPVALAEGQSHKALVALQGRPMISWVAEALRPVEGLHSLYVMSERTDLLTKAGIKECVLLGTAASPAGSLVKAIEEIGVDLPLLVTTADHPLLEPEMVRHLLHHAPEASDIAVGLARADLVSKKYPGAIRTFYRFKRHGYSGCNLFFIQGTQAKKVAEFWQQMEAWRKKPWRIAAKVGFGILLRYLLGKLTLEEAFGRISALTGATITPIILPFPEAAIDIDRPEDLKMVRGILEARH